MFKSRRLGLVRFTTEFLAELDRDKLRAYGKVMSAFIVVRAEYDVTTQTYIQTLYDPTGAMFSVLAQGDFIPEYGITFTKVVGSSIFDELYSCYIFKKT